MAGEINRKALARGLCLSTRVGERGLARGLRRFLRKLRDYGRPFVLSPSLDIVGCLAVVKLRLAEEQRDLDAISHEFDAEVARARTKFEERERHAWMRIWALQLILECAHRPPLKPSADGSE